MAAGVAGGHQVAAQPARARAQIDHIIGALDGFGVVLHHQHRVAHVAQVRQRLQQTLIVARMQADGRLVEHVEHAAQLRSDLRGQADALRLAARKRGGGAVQAQVVQPDRRKKLQPPADLVQHAAGDLRLAVVELPVAHRHQRARDRQRREFGNREILHPHRQAGRPQPLAVAGGALGRRHVIGEPLAVAFRGRSS